MANIFISYRREDSAGHTGHLFDDLRKHFGEDRVFMDIAAIEPGMDFKEAIDKALETCDVFIVVVGKQWLNVTDAKGRRRLDDPDDVNRLEIAAALRRNIRVVPILVQGATMPGLEYLPEDLKSLSRRNAHEMSDGRWDYDVGQLIKALEKARKSEPHPPPRPSLRKVFVTVVIAVLLIVGIAYWRLRPQESAVVPDVVGQTIDQAKARLGSARLEIGNIKRIPTKERPQGMVLAQSPLAGTRVVKGQKVNLDVVSEISEPVARIEMPDVVRKPLEEAVKILKEAGLQVGPVAVKKGDEKGQRIVLEQSPVAGTRVEKGRRVTLKVGSPNP